MLVGALIAIGSLALGLVAMVVSHMLVEEVESRLERLPRTVVELAVRRLPREERSLMSNDWHGGLDAYLKDTEKLPLTGLLRGIRFAASLHIAVPGIRRELGVTASWPSYVHMTLRWTSASAALIEAIGWVIEVAHPGAGHAQLGRLWAAAMLLTTLGAAAVMASRFDRFGAPVMWLGLTGMFWLMISSDQMFRPVIGKHLTVVAIAVVLPAFASLASATAEAVLQQTVPAVTLGRASFAGAFLGTTAGAAATNHLSAFIVSTPNRELFVVAVFCAILSVARAARKLLPPSVAVGTP